MRAAQQRYFFRIGCEAESVLRHGIHQERIDRRADAVFGTRLWNRRVANRLKRPEGAFLIGDDAAFPNFDRLGSGGLCAASDPLFDQGHLVPRQFVAALGHLAAVDHLEEQALVRLTGNDHWPIIAALEHQTAQSQIEAAAQLVALAVTIETMCLEDRADVLLEGWRRSGERRCAG